LKSKQYDFVNVFVQAPLRPGEELYMTLPSGYRDDLKGSHACKLKKSLYGWKQGSVNWYLHLQEGLRQRGIRQSELDPGICFSPTLILITDEGNFETFLGVSVKQFEDKSIELTQPQFIRKLLKVLDLGEVNPKPTPAVEVLSKDVEGEARRYQWNYRQAVGILEYLKITTRPDITFAVSQVARFSNNPKRSHGKALIRIARYLKGTNDKGLVINPTTDSFFECYCDAHFCGLWQVTDPEDPKSVHSRTGFVIVYAGVPIIWCSKLQTQIAFSTVEAEYLALSHSAREIIPTQELLQEIAQSFNFHIPRQSQIHCDIYEDNNGALELATTPKIRPRTKHFGVCYHHFRNKLQDGSLRVHPLVPILVCGLEN